MVIYTQQKNVFCCKNRSQTEARMEIKRDIYLNKLISKKNNGLVKVITGIRRCGKSYLLNTIFYNHLLESGVAEDHIIRFAFDSADDLHLRGTSLRRITTSMVF